MRKRKFPWVYAIFITAITTAVGLMFITSNKETFTNTPDELYEQDISMNSNGSDSVYVNNGVRLSLDGLYFNDNFIAIRLTLVNNSSAMVHVDASIETMNQTQELSAKPNTSCIKYIILGDDRASSYDMGVSITQNEKTLGSGIVHIAQSPKFATVLTEQSVLYYDSKMEIYYLGKQDNAAVFLFKNKTNVTKTVTLSTPTYSYKVIVPVMNNYYSIAMGMNSSLISINQFDVKYEDMDDITIH